MITPPIALALKRASFDVDQVVAQVESRMRVLSSVDLRTEHVISQASLFHLEAGGKRTRAKLAASASASLGLTEGDAVSIATVVELLHNASLVHDDLQDGDEARRGRHAVWRAFGSDVAICVGDLMISGAYRAAAELENAWTLPAVLRSIHDVVETSVRGQQDDLHARRNPVTEFSDYELIAIEKSAPLLALPIQLALIVAGEDHARTTANSAARHFAVGYQIADDLADLSEDQGLGESEPALNAILVLERRAARATSVAQAIRIALDHLDRAKSHARDLPSGSGGLLSRLCDRLIAEIDSAATALTPAPIRNRQ